MPIFCDPSLLPHDNVQLFRGDFCRLIDEEDASSSAAALRPSRRLGHFGRPRVVTGAKVVPPADLLQRRVRHRVGLELQRPEERSGEAQDEKGQGASLQRKQATDGIPTMARSALCLGIKGFVFMSRVRLKLSNLQGLSSLCGPTQTNVHGRP